MSTWSYNEILGVTGASWVTDPPDDAPAFTGVAIDSRQLTPGQIFFAFVGEHADGHAYLPQAADRGASLCVVTDTARVPKDFTVPTLLVGDAQAALTDLARAWRDKLSCTVIAVTGSNGKTTTCRLMHGVCRQSGASFVSPKSFNNALGVPITILNTPLDARYLIAELGTSTPGEITQRTALAKPDIAIITSIGRAHLEALGSVEGVAREKAALIAALPETGHAFFPAGITPLEDAIALLRPGAGVTRLGQGSALRVIESTPLQTRFSINDAEFAAPLPGAHNASNAGLCVLVGRALGLDDAQIRAGLLQTQGPPMRFERIEITTETDPIVVINDAYNANPDSMRAALTTFNAMKMPMPGITNKTAVLGEMLELGDASGDEHRALVRDLEAQTGIDRFVLLGAGFESIAMSHLIEVHADRSDFSVERVAAGIAPGTCVLLKGSRGVRLERLIDALTKLHTPAPVTTQTHA